MAGMSGANPGFGGVLPPAVLVVDDDEVTRKLLQEVLAREGYRVFLSPSGERAIQDLQREKFAVVLSDIRMLETDGMAVLREVKRVSKDSMVILMTGFGSMEGAVDAIQAGAFDYVSKPFKINELKAVVARAIKHGESLIAARAPGGGAGRGDTGAQRAFGRGLIGKSPQIVEVYKTLARAALAPSTILIKGESGTGKELVARAIHDHGPRRGRPFTSINCGAVTEAQLEIELFGQEQPGLIEQSTGGSLFLDEVGDLTPALQVRLLKLIETGEIRRVGTAEARAVDVRVIAATHRDLESMVRAAAFREDLYYRLKVIAIELPPLRERMEDLPELVETFVARFSAQHHKAVSHVSDEAMAILRGHLWPGNVRELERSIERAVAMTRSAILFPEDFPPELLAGATANANPHATAGSAAAPSLEDLERAHIARVLQETNYNKSKASEVLGIDRATLYRKAQRYGIDLRGK